MAGIKEALGELVPNRRLSRLSEDTRLRDLAIDSMGMVQFVTQLENVFQLDFAVDDLAPENFRDISSVLRLLERKKAEVRSG